MARLTDEIKTQLEKMDSMQEIELFQKKKMFIYQLNIHY